MAANINAGGFGLKLDPDNSKHVAAVRNLMLITGLIVAIGITLSVTENYTKIPSAVRNAMIKPLDGIATTIFTMSVIGYALMKLTAKPKGQREERARIIHNVVCVDTQVEGYEPLEFWPKGVKAEIIREHQAKA